MTTVDTMQKTEPSKIDGSAFGESIARATSGKPYLGNIQVVDKLVREFCKGAMERLDEHEMSHNTDDAMDQTQAACRGLARILSGQDNRYQPIGAWNTDGLAQACRNGLMELDPSMTKFNPEDAICETCALLVLMLYQASGRFIGNNDTDNVQEEVDRIIHAAVFLFLGMPRAEETFFGLCKL